jgi:hypothetical protein
MKIIITESRIEKTAIHWLNKNFGDLEKFTTDRMPSVIFYRTKEDKEIIFEYHTDYEYLYVNKEIVWSFLMDMFGFDDNQITQLIDEWFQNRYNVIRLKDDENVRPSGQQRWETLKQQRQYGYYNNRE